MIWPMRLKLFQRRLLFSRAKPAVVGHDAMADGKFCGACHDGKVAFTASNEDGDCEACHVE